MQRTLSLASCMVVAAVLAGCSSSDPHDGPVQQLSEAQAQEVLLTAETLGEGYESAPDEDDDSGERPELGCIDAIGDFDEGVDVDARAEFLFQPQTTAGVPQVTNGALSFETVAQATTFMERFTDTFTDCDAVEERSENGVEVDLDVTLDAEQLAVLEIDEQVNLQAGGSFAFNDQALKFSVAMSVVRVENNVVAVLTTDMADLEIVGPLTQEYLRLAVGRLTAVAGGQEPPDDVATVTPSPHTGPAVTA